MNMNDYGPKNNAWRRHTYPRAKTLEEHEEVLGEFYKQGKQDGQFLGFCSGIALVLMVYIFVRIVSGAFF